MNNKIVFISHSSKDFEFADKVCKILEGCNLPCWIAPRDIPYGDVWAGNIAQAICRAKVLLFIYSENSNKSPQVVNEIMVALKNNIRVIPIHISDEEYNLSLQYLLSQYQRLDIKQDCAEKQIKELASRISMLIESNEPDNAVTYNRFLDNLNLEINEDVNIDESIDWFSGESDLVYEEVPETNSFKQKLLDRIAQSVSESMLTVHDANDESSNENEDDFEADDENENHSSEENGIYFSLNERTNHNIMVFIVRRIINEADYTNDYSVELLEKTTEAADSSNNTAYFSVDNPDANGNPLIILDFVKNAVVVAMGFRDGNTIKIGKKMKPMEMSLSSNGNDTVRFKANERGIIIIDPVTGDVVERKKYFSHTSNTWCYYVEVVPNKKYFVFDVHSKGEKLKMADPFLIGYGYYKGCYGLPQNVIEAAVWFEKAATKQAYYYLAEIFKNDPLLQSEEDYKYYMKLYNSAKR